MKHNNVIILISMMFFTIGIPKLYAMNRDEIKQSSCIRAFAIGLAAGGACNLAMPDLRAANTFGSIIAATGNIAIGRTAGVERDLIAQACATTCGYSIGIILGNTIRNNPWLLLALL